MFTQEEKGYCTRCGTDLVDRFTDKFIETDGKWHGRYVDDYGKLQCPHCFKSYAIDGSFQSRPYYKLSFDD